MGIYPKIPTEKLCSTLHLVFEKVGPKNMLILCEPESFPIWQEALKTFGQGSQRFSVRIETRTFVQEQELATFDELRDFNSKVFSSLRSMNESDFHIFYQDLRARHTNRLQVEFPAQELREFDFIVIDDSLLTSRFLISAINHPSTLCITGVKTFKSYFAYSKLLTENSAQLLYEDHSTPQGLAVFQRHDEQLLKETLFSDASAVQVEDTSFLTPLHHIIGLSPPSYEDRPSILIVIPPELHRAFGNFGKAHQIAIENTETNIFIVAPEYCQDLYSRINGVQQVFPYNPAALYQDKSRMRSFVKGLTFLTLEKLYVLNDEEDILSALLTYNLTKQDTTIIHQSELVHNHSEELALLPIKNWERDWAHGFMTEFQLTPSQTIIVCSGGKYPNSRILHSLKKFTDSGAYRIVHIGERDELFHEEVIRLPEGITFGQMAGVLSQSRLVVGCETSGGYLAQLVGTPQTIIIGGTALQSYPFGANRTTFACLPFGCSTCADSCRHDPSQNCLDELPEEIITIAVEHALKGYHGTSTVFFAAQNGGHMASAEEAHLTLLQHQSFNLVPVKVSPGTDSMLFRSNANLS